MCWVCDQWTFTLYFWNEQVGRFDDRNYIGIASDTKAKLVQTIRLHNADSYLDHDDRPVFFSSATQWRPRPFMHFLDFLETLEPGNEPNHEERARSEALLKFKIASEEEIEDRNRTSF